MARGSIEKYEGKRGISWRLRIVTGYDERGYPIVRRRTVKGSKREAEVKLREFLLEVDKGSFIESNNMMLESFLHRWFEVHCQGIALTTERRYRGDINNHIIPSLGKVPLQKLATLQIQEFANQLLLNGYKGRGSPRGLAPKSVRDCVGLLKLALEQAVDWGLLARNPVIGVKAPKVAQKEIKVIQEHEADAILKALEGTYMWIPTMIAYHTGMRRGEVLALSWDCTDLISGTIIVKRSSTLHGKNCPTFKEPKTRSGRRIVEIGPTLIQALIMHRECQESKLSGNWYNEHDLVCTRDDGRFIPPDTFSESFRHKMNKLGIDLTFHGLRHTHVSMLIKAGVPINVISARIGHSNPSTTHDVYSHLLPGMNRDAVKRFERLLRDSLTHS